VTATRPCIRIDTHRVLIANHCCDGTCSRGRGCPQLVNRVSPMAGTPKGKPVNDYRRTSGAWTGFAPRTTEQRWPTPPRSISLGWRDRLSGWLRSILGR
jgi:hypothetical protein